MAWSGGNFTRANPTWATDASLGIGIEAGRHDAQDNDFTAGIDQCLNKTGQNSMTGDLNLGGYRPTNVAAGTAAAPAICTGNDVNTGIFGPAADTVAIATNGSERMRIDSSGRVGIGTTSPGFLLDAQLTSANAAAFQRFAATGDGPFVTLIKSRGATVGTNTIVQAGDTLGTIAFGGTNGTSYNDAAYIRGTVDNTPGASNDMPGRLEFHTTPDGSGLPSERMRIDSSGRVGIGTTTPAYQLQLSSDSAAKPTTNTWTIASDERIKTNVQPYAKGLAEICQVNPITYDYNGRGGIPAGPGGVSILAQELQPVFPECVGSYKAKLNEDDEDETDILNYNGHAVTFALINAVKELNAKVEALEAKVQALEAVTEV